MDEELPASPAQPRSKAIVRDKYLINGWATPPGNLVMVYLESCERHNLPANSAVLAQLHRRMRLLQSGPWQRVTPPPPEPSPLAPAGGPSPAPPPAPTSSQLALEAAQTAQELKDLIFCHVHPLPLGTGAGADAAAAAAASSVGRSGGMSEGGASSDGGSWPTASSANHAATLGSAARAAARLAGGGGGAGVLYSEKAVAAVCRLVDPRTPWHQQRAAAGLANGSRVLSGDDFRALLDAAAAPAALGELRQAALEVLSRPVGHGTLELEGLLGALFDHLDVVGQGSIPASELRTVVGAFCPAAAADMYGLIQRHPPLARPGPQQVSRQEFVDVLSSLAPRLAPPGSSPARVRDRAELAVNAILDSKIREPFSYDFSRAYLGPRGLLPLLDALGRDPAFVRLSLANCGLGCSAVERLVGWMQGHPCLTSLDLSNNLIADRGGLALVRLLQDNPRIVELGIGSTALLPPRASRTHHDSLGPSPCEDAGPLLEALAANRAARRASPREIVEALRQHGPELRAMCFSLLAQQEGGGCGDSDGGGGGGQRHAGRSGGGGSVAGGERVPLQALRQALGEVTAEWGFTPEALDEVMQHERLLGTATAGRTADDSGRLGVTYEELMHFLRSDDRASRVARAFRNHLAEAKEIFFALAPPDAAPPPAAAGAAGAAGASPAGVSGPRTALSTVRQAIVAAASQPGSGWDVSEEDLEAVLTPGFLRPHLTAAPTGNARPLNAGGVGGGGAGGGGAGGGGGGGSAFGVVGPDGLLLPDWSPSAPAARAGLAAPTGPAADMLISWPELSNCLLYLFNR